MTKPRVFIGIPTGPPKRYALAYMFAALQNLDWDNKEIHWAITDYDKEFNNYIEKLADTIPLNGDVHLHYTHLTEKEREKPFGPVLANLSLLRRTFLDGDCPYFLLLGGDNPPQRDTVKRLTKLDADVAMGTCYQRPGRGWGTAAGGLPMLWQPAWRMEELAKFNLHPQILDEFRTAFVESSFLIPIICDPNWRRRKSMEAVVGGSGCVLIKRDVFERIGFYLPRCGYHSEDIQFFMRAIEHGYRVKADLKLHVPHFAPDGRVY